MKVRDFAVTVLNEINTAIKKAKDEGLPLRKISTLGQYQTDNWFVGLLKVELEHIINSDKKHPLADYEVSEESLQVFVGMLEKQQKFTWETYCIYNSLTTSDATIAADILAENLVRHLKNPKYKHQYDYMFPGFPCSRFTSSKGSLQALSLNEFFWTSNGFPVEVLACLDKYRSDKNSVNPRHVCLQEADLKNCPELSDDDRLRLTQHSPEARNYDWAICHSNSDAEKDECRQKLVEAIASKNFIPGYEYVDSDKTLLANGALSHFGLSSLDTAAQWLVRVHPDDWLSMVKCLDYDTVLSMTLPKTVATASSAAKPDTSIFKRGNEEKLKEYLNQSKWYVPCGEDMKLNKAAFFLLAELFKRIRERELDHTGAFAQATGYAVNKNQKISALEFFQEFLLSDHRLNQLQEFAKLRGHLDDYAVWLQDGRTALLVEKAKLLWESLIKQASLTQQPSAGEEVDSSNVLQRQEANYAIKFDGVYSLRTLQEDALYLCKFSKLRWMDKVQVPFHPTNGRMNAFRSYILSFLSPKSFLDNIITLSDDFQRCVASKQHYQENSHTFNRAVLFLFAHYYEFFRNLDNDNTSTFGKARGAPTKNDKLALTIEFKRFLISDYELNEFTSFIAKECKTSDQPALMNTLNDKAYSSQLNKLIEQAANVYSPTFFAEEQARDAQQASAAWSYVPSWFGGAK